MNKILLFEKLKLEIETNLKSALQAAQNTYAIATHEDSKAENKYDTRGLEASYLAGAQAQRVVDLRDTLSLVSIVNIKSFNSKSKIALTAVVEIICNQKKSYVLILSKGGGHSFQFEDKWVQVITPESPLGKDLIGKEIDDCLQIGNKEYQILQIY